MPVSARVCLIASLPLLSVALNQRGALMASLPPLSGALSFLPCWWQQGAAEGISVVVVDGSKLFAARRCQRTITSVTGRCEAVDDNRATYDAALATQRGAFTVGPGRFEPYRLRQGVIVVD